MRAAILIAALFVAGCKPSAPNGREDAGPSSSSTTRRTNRAWPSATDTARVGVAPTAPSNLCPNSLPVACGTRCCPGGSTCNSGGCVGQTTTPTCSSPDGVFCRGVCCPDGSTCNQFGDCAGIPPAPGPACEGATSVDCSSYCCRTGETCSNIGAASSCSSAPDATSCATTGAIACGSGTCCPAGFGCNGNSVCYHYNVLFYAPCAAGYCHNASCVGSTCTTTNPPSVLSTCPSGTANCGTTCAAPDFSCQDCGATTCLWPGNDSGGTACGTAVCPNGSACLSSVCCRTGDQLCGSTCCPSNLPCDGSRCGCPPGATGCGDVCCPAGLTCSNGACVGDRCLSTFPTPCGDSCCGTESACENGNCICPADHPVQCGEFCCLTGAQCTNDGIDCGCPPGEQPCAGANGCCPIPPRTNGSHCFTIQASTIGACQTGDYCSLTQADCESSYQQVQSICTCHLCNGSVTYAPNPCQ